MTLTTAQSFDTFVQGISLTDAQRLEVQAKREKTEEYAYARHSHSLAICR